MAKQEQPIGGCAWSPTRSRDLFGARWPKRSSAATA